MGQLDAATTPGSAALDTGTVPAANAAEAAQAAKAAKVPPPPAELFG